MRDLAIKRLDIRLSSSNAFLDVARRVEYFMLLALSVLVALHPSITPVLSLPLLALALMLVPGERVRGTTREKARLDTLNALQTEGLQIRSRCLDAWEEPLTQERALLRSQIGREITIWLDACGQKLKRYPEVAGIFEDHVKDEGVLAELDSCLERLSHVKRLLSLSERLQLPI